MRRLLIYLLIFVIYFPILAGEYAASFLDIGVGARALGMGGAFCSIADDESAFYWNPAGLGFVDRIHISGMYGPQFGTLRNPLGHFHFMGYIQPLRGKAVASFNWIRLSVDDIAIYPELQGDSKWDRLHNPSLRPTGNPDGYMRDTEDALFFSFAVLNQFELDLGWKYNPLPIDIPLGINIKAIRQSLGDYGSSGIGLDFGMMVRFHMDTFLESPWWGILSFGIQFQDVTGTHISWNTDYQDFLPSNTKWGLSYRQPLKKLNGELNVSFDKDSRWRGRKRWGLEFSGFQVFALRVGIDHGQFTCGVGLRFWIMNVNYAILTHEMDSIHRISCSISIK
ncbi:hypothetical protein JW824_00960 [bacterium]|nr:hypothetical protein [bacterium]RQV98663.1 MAG: hypothetical protein EH221_01485 [bacterium]